MSESKNNVAWRKIFEKYNIVTKIKQEGSYKIKSSEIKEFREPRLMTKFDYESQRPQIFRDNDFSILPVTRGSYIISDFQTFKNFEDNDVEIQRMSLPSYLESIDINNITSEATALHCAYASKMIEDFTEEEYLLPTVSGRMSSSSFSFKIDTTVKAMEIEVAKSQIEIDGGYEGANSLNLIEVKNSISKDFLIRQLYYPYRLWHNKISKKVRSYFLTYTNGIFHFREYNVEDSNHYNSLKLIREKKYVVREGVINMELIQQILNDVQIVQEPKIPFPQANSFERVINLCELLSEKTTLYQDNITHNYDFDARQTNYYTDAGRYLGLIEKRKTTNGIAYLLTKKGKKIFQQPIFDRQIRFIELILSHLVFNNTLKLYFKEANAPNKKEIVRIMEKSNLYNIHSQSTFYRRSSTILRWINWILEQIEE